MKEIIINNNNLSEDEITDIKIENNYIFKYNDKLLLKSHHNAYYFIHKDDLVKEYNNEPFLVKKEYILDYPFIGDKLLYIHNYYLIEDNVDIENTKWMDIDNVISELEKEKYLNPRLHEHTDEIIQILKIILNNK